MIMNKTAQNLTWNCLPLEVKKEVKRQYQIAINAKEYYTECTLEYLFGIHKLTSDAEGEEMLCVSRKKVQGLYDLVYEIYADGTKEWYQGYMKAMQDLFGDKCLPDVPEVNFTKTEQIAENAKCPEAVAKNATTTPSEPEFKRGDIVRVTNARHSLYEGLIGTVDTVVKGECHEILVNHRGSLISFHASELEPYTSQDPIPPKSGDLKPQNAETQTQQERTEPTCTDDCPSPCPSQHFDDIISRDFADHNRLHIAAILAAGMLASEVRCYPVDRALELADQLIKKSKEDEEQ